jgi:hypothetical protein
MNGLLGARTLSFNYELMTSAVESTPADVKWWSTRMQNVRNLILLTNKSINIGDATVIYQIGSAEVRGFQFGDPNVLPYVVELDLFDAADNHYKVIITGKSKKRPGISQAEINALVASFHSLSSPTRSSTSASGN